MRIISKWNIPVLVKDSFAKSNGFIFQTDHLNSQTTIIIIKKKVEKKINILGWYVAVASTI